MSNNNRKHNSCIRVLEFLKLLTMNDVALNELHDIDKNTFKDIGAHETFLKYVSTIDFAGLRIKKIGKKYSLCDAISKPYFSKREIDLLLAIYDYFDECCVESYRAELIYFYENIKKFLPNEFKELFNEKINKGGYKKSQKLAEKAQYYQNIVDFEQKLKITMNGEEKVLEPRKIEINNGKIYLHAFCPQESVVLKIITDKIEKLEILPEKNKTGNFAETVVFEVYNRLAVNYRLRECEHIQSFSDDKKVIVNCGEDKNTLIKRLLKYGENCKVVAPKNFINDYLSALQKIKDKLNGAKNEENRTNTDR